MRFPAFVTAPGYQVQTPALPQTMGPYYYTDHGDFWRFAAVVVVALAVLAGGYWAIGTGVINQNYGFCVTPLCNWVTRTQVQAAVNLSLAPRDPIVVPAPPAAPTIVMQPTQPQVIYQPAAPAPIVVPAPQQHVIVQQQSRCCGGGAQFAPMSRPVQFAPRPTYRPRRLNPTSIGGYPNGFPPGMFR